MIGNEISPIIHLRLETSRGSVNEDEELLEEIVAAVSQYFVACTENNFAQHVQLPSKVQTHDCFHSLFGG